MATSERITGRDMTATVLTAAEEHDIDQVAAEYVQIVTAPRTLDIDAARSWVDYVYRVLFNCNASDVPAITVCDSPYAAIKLARELTGDASIVSTDYCGVSEAYWVAELDAYHRLGQVLDTEYAPVALLSAFVRCAWDTLLLSGAALVIRMPTAIRLDSNGRLHADADAAVEWADGEREFFWHGVSVPGRLISTPESYAADEYARLPAELRRALGERLGWGRLVALLGGVVVDETVADGLTYALLRCPDRSQYLRMRSPMLKDGSSPDYVEPCHEDLNTAAGARKWRVGRRTDGSWMSASECDEDPSISLRFHC